MVYKKYIKRGGKSYGPYKYHSRKVNGKVITEYLGKHEEKKNNKRKKLLTFLIIALITFSLIIALNYNKIYFNNGIKIIKSTLNNIIAPIAKSLTGFTITNNETINKSQIILGKPVKWKEYFLINSTNNSIKLPEEAEKINIKKINSENKFLQVIENLRITGNVVQEKNNEITLTQMGQYEIGYETPAPYSVEESLEEGDGKKITIVGPETIHYENVLAFTDLPKESSKKYIKLYRTTNGIREQVQITSYQDLNNNGLIDYIEWIIPQLSSQTYELIIEITKAEHLDSNKNFISDIYEEVKALDGIWSEEIPSEDYVRVTFEQELDSSRDITVYPRIIDGEPRIEVYEVDGSEIIVEFTNIISNEYNKVLLTNLQGTQDVFDLKVIDGSLEFEHIVDPVEVLTPIEHTNSQLGGVALDPAQITAITSDDETNVILAKGILLTVEVSELSGTIDTLTDANCSLIYYTATGYPASSITFEVYDSFGGNQLDISTLPASETDSLVHLVDLETKGLAASEVTSMVVYVKNTIAAKGYNLYVNKIFCTIDYTEAQDNPPTWSNPSENDSSPNPGQVVKHNVYWQDDNDLSYATLEVNSSGVDCDTTANVTNITLSGLSQWANLTWTVPNACEGKTIGWRQYANDSLNQWNSSMPLQTYTVENINPTASFGTDPIDTYNSTSQLVTFNLSCSDNLGVSTLQLWGNWTGIWHANQTNSTPVNDTFWNVTVDNIPEGKGHIWAVWCNDSVGNEDWTNTNRTFTVDSIGPTINTEGANETNISQNEYFCLNITVTDTTSDVSIVYAEVWNTTHWVNYTMNDTGTSCGGGEDDVYGVEIQGTAQGIWNYSKTHANDTLNNWNSSDFADLTINVTAPSDTYYPQFSNFQEYLENNSDYSYGQSYQFNSTIVNTNGTIFLSFNGTNYSASNVSDEFYVDITSLSAGNYNYYWFGYGNGTNKNYNQSSIRVYVIQKINPTASLTNVTDPWTVTYPEEVTINYSESHEGDGDVVYTVYRDGVNKSSGETVLLGYGNYEYVLNTTGGTNYTTNSSIDAETLTVNQNTGSCSVVFNESSGITYPATFNVWTNCTSGFVLYRNSSAIDNNSEQNLAASSYNFTVIRNDTVNYSNYYDEREFIVEQAIGEVATHIDNQRGNKSVLLNSKRWLNATLITGVGDIKLYYNNTLINQGASPRFNLTNFTSEGEFNVSGIYDGNENYTSDYETWWVTVSTDSAPDVNIVYPENIIYKVNVSVLNYTVEDDINLSHCWYSLNGGANSTPDADCSNHTDLTSNEGPNIWTVWANDSIGQESSDSVTFTKDTTYPTFSNYQRNPDLPHEDQNVQVNVTIAETNLDKVILEWNGTTNYTVSTNISNEYYFAILQGNYTAHDSITYYWYANDTAGNMNKSSEQGFTVSNQIPSVSAPAINDTTPKTNDILNCTGGDFSDNDAEDDTEQARYFKWYDADVEISGQTSQTLDLSLGGLNKGDVIKCSVMVYDGYDNSSWVNSSNTATINNTAPTIDNPQTQVSWNANGSTYYYDYNATDPDSGDSFTWYDNTTLFDINSATGVISDIPTENETGTYSIRISVSDGTVNATEDFTYTINDTTSPNINFQPPTETNGSQLTRNYIQVNVSSSDGKAIDTITVRLYNSTSLVQTNTSSTSPLFVNFTNLPDENYYFNATVNDTSGNTNQTETKHVSTDTGPPTINYVLPTENSGIYKSQNYVEVNVTASDPNLDKIVIRLYNSAHTQIDSATTSSSPNFANFTGLSNGLYYYNATANDTFGNDDSLATRNITLDTIVPLIDFTTGTETNDTTHSRDWIFVNVTVIEDNEDTITFLLYNQTTLVNETSSTDSTREINWTGLPNEIYYYNVSVNDTAGNSNLTETRTILLDTEGPQVSSLTEFPDDPADYSEGRIYMFNATVVDPSLDVVWVDFNGTNHTATHLGSNIYHVNFTILAVGNYSYRWYANDSFSNLNDSENGTYTINQGVPNLTLTITPSTTVNYSTQTNATGSGCPEQLNCKLYRDGIDITSENGQNITLGVGVYNYTYNVTGNTNYTSASVSDNLTINQATGEVYTYLDNLRANKTIEQFTEIYLNGTLEKGQAGDTIKLYYNNTLINQGVPPLYNLTNFTIIGLYNITTIYDGNENYTSAYETWWVNVSEADVTPPQISIISPQNNTSYNLVQTQLNYTASDNFGLNECWYSLNNGITNTTITCEQNITGLDSGQESSTWIIYANDSKGNENSSSVTFFVDSINPTIGFVASTLDSGETIGENVIQINVTANDTNLANITIRLYNSTGYQIRINTSSTSPFPINYTELTAGTYYFNATANDTLNNQNSTETRNITLVTPILTIIKPKNETYMTKSSLPLKYSANYEDFVWYNIDLGQNNTNITSPMNFNTTEGSHTLYLYANNSVGTTTKNVTFTVNLTKFIIYYNEYKDANKGNSTDFNEYSYDEIQNLSDIILEHTSYGKISFNEAINITDDANVSNNEIDLDTNINISENRIEIDSTALPNFNKSATLYFYGLSLSNPRALRDEIVCPSGICTSPIYSFGAWSFNVTGFTIYSLEDIPIEEEAPSGGPSAPTGGAECLQDSDCEGKDEVCWNYKCVKLFDIKIIDFESPVELGDFFDFTYLIKGMATIDDDVEVRFWIEKDGEKVTSGSDTIYLGSFEEKTETTKIFLPTNIKSGVYTFYIQVLHQAYEAKSHRTIEIQIEGEIATITPIEKDFKIYIIFVLIIFILFLLLFYIKRKKKISPEPIRFMIKKPKEKKQIFMPRRYSLKEVLESIEVAYLKIRSKLKLIFERIKEKIKKKETAEELIKNVGGEKEKKSAEELIKEVKSVKEGKGRKSAEELIKEVKSVKEGKGRKSAEELIKEVKSVKEKPKEKAGDIIEDIIEKEKKSKLKPKITKQQKIIYKAKKKPEKLQKKKIEIKEDDEEALEEMFEENSKNKKTFTKPDIKTQFNIKKKDVQKDTEIKSEEKP